MTAKRMEDNGGQSNHLATKDYPGTHEQLPSPSQLQGKKNTQTEKKLGDISNYFEECRRGGTGRIQQGNVRMS